MTSSEKEKKYDSKDQQRRKPAKTFLQRKVELRNVKEIPPAQPNELLSVFVRIERGLVSTNISLLSRANEIAGTQIYSSNHRA